MSKITIVIPCYNAGQYLTQCIKSLESQSYKDFSVIFIDDASSDDTHSILNELRVKSDFSVTIIENKTNKGPAYSRNRAIKIANSEYITFCDSDDWYDFDFLEKMIRAIEYSKAPIALCGYKIVDEYGNKKYRKIINTTSILSSKEALCLESDSLCMLMVKTSIMKSTLLPDIRNGEDVAVVPLLIAKAGRCVVMAECFYNYYRRTDSVSEKPSMKVVSFLCDSYMYTMEHIPKGYDLELEYLGIKNMLYGTLITLFSISNDCQYARRILKGFKKKYPNWERNPYMKSMPIYKRLILYFAKYRLFFLIKFMAYIRMKRI